MRVTVLTPTYNDWAALTILIEALDRALQSAQRTAHLLIVDDGSEPPPTWDTNRFELGALTGIEVLHLRRNLGHQRAIAVGLAYLEAGSLPDAVVVMDGDGEDRPEDVNALIDALERNGGERVVFAERTRRSEGIVFATLYWAYRVVHKQLTGERVRVGNFSIIPARLLRRLVTVSDLWNHFAAAVFHSKIPFTTISTSRGSRYAGMSQMNFVSLVSHGLSAMSVFSDRIGVRLLMVASALTAAAVVATALFVTLHIRAGIAIPSWTPYAVMAMGLLVFLLFASSLAFVFIILGGRGTSGFLPFREFVHYVSHSTSVPIVRANVDQHVHRH